MPITLTAAQYSASIKPDVEPFFLVDMQDKGGSEWHLTTDALSWSGVTYGARAVGLGRIASAVGAPGTPAPPKTFSMRVANPDGWFTARERGWWKGQRITVKEVFLDVSSDAVRTYKFTVTGHQMTSPTEVEFQAQDFMAPIRRKMVPDTTRAIITDSMYPNRPTTLPEGTAVPVLFGRTYTPLIWVDDLQDSWDVFLACAGSATLSGVVAQWDPDFGMTGITFYLDDGITFAYSVSYASRAGVPVTEIIIGKKVIDTDVGLYADMTWGAGSQDATPDMVLLQLLADCDYGAGFNLTLVDTVSWLTARSWYRANSIFMDGTITQARPLEDWLGFWEHDALTKLIFRDKLYFAPQVSQAPVASLFPGNIVAGTLRMSESELEESARTVVFKERTSDGTGPIDRLEVPTPYRSSVRYSRTSSVTVEVGYLSPFIGRKSLAQRAAQFWAMQQNMAARQYVVEGTTKLIRVEEGDFVTLEHSQYLPVGSYLCYVAAVARGAGQYAFSLQDADYSLYDNMTLPVDPPFTLDYQFVSFTQVYTIPAGGGNVAFTSSHGMGQKPNYVTPRGAANQKKIGQQYSYLQTSIIASNNSLFNVNVYIKPGVNAGIPLTNILAGFDLRFLNTESYNPPML